MSQFVPIGKVAEVNPTIPKTLGDSPNEAVTFLPMAAVSEKGRIIAPEESSIGTVIKGYRYFEQGDVLLAKITPCMENGKAAFVEDISHKIGFGSTEFHVLRPSSEVDGRYLFYMVWNPIFRQVAERNMTGTAGQRRVPTDFVKRYKIPLPTLEEQRRIAVILDKADAVRRKRQEALALTEQLLRAAFLEMFGDLDTNPKEWEVVPIESVAASTRNALAIGPFGSSLKVDDYRKSGHPVVFVRDIRENRFNWVSEVFVDDKKFQELQSHHVRPGDIVATKMGLPPCIAAVYPNSMPIGVVTADIIKVTSERTKMTPLYVAAAINSDFCKRQVARFTEGITRPKVTLRDFKQLLIPCPPLSYQERWEALCNQHQVATARLSTNLDNLNNLFNSLLQRAFRGEL